MYVLSFFFVKKVQITWILSKMKELYLVIFSHVSFHGQFHVFHVDSMVIFCLKAHGVIENKGVRNGVSILDFVSFVL